MATNTGPAPHPIYLAGRWVTSPDVLVIANPARPDEPAGSTVAAMAKDLAEAKGKDHVTLVVSPQPNAIRIRLTAEEGVLQLLGTAFKTAQAGGGLPGLGQ